MKALEPVLKYHFWILLGLGLLLAIIGWWMTTGSMQAATATARGKLDEADKNKDVGEVPSDDYAKNLKAINAQQKLLVDRTWAWLYAQQKERMVWPEVIAEAASKLKYREDFKDLVLATIYRDNYYKEVERVYRIPLPINESDNSGIVHFPFSVLPHIEWGDLTPTSQEMWDSMEDLWLLEPILEAVYQTNGGENAKRHEAIVVAIEYLGLYGGDRSKIGQPEGQQGGGGGTGGGAGSTGGLMGAPSTSMPSTGSGRSSGMIGDGAGGGGKSGSAPTIATDIDPVEEFGDPGSAAKSGGGGGGNAGPGAPGGGGGGSPGSSGSSSGNSGGPRRYIDDDQTKPFRTRGFKLTVLMDHRKVPDLYAQLTSSGNSPWPIQILRMNVARLNETGSLGSGSQGGGGGGNQRRQGGGGAIGGLTGGGGAIGGGGLGDISGGSPSASDEVVNPFLARVTFVGLITLYNEPPAIESAADTPAATPPVTNNQPVAPNAGEPAAEPADETPSTESVSETASPSDDAGATGPEKPESSGDEPAPEDDSAGDKPAVQSEPGDSTPAGNESSETESESESETAETESASSPK